MLNTLQHDGTGSVFNITRSQGSTGSGVKLQHQPSSQMLKDTHAYSTSLTVTPCRSSLRDIAYALRSGNSCNVALPPQARMEMSHFAVMNPSTNTVVAPLKQCHQGCATSSA